MLDPFPLMSDAGSPVQLVTVFCALLALFAMLCVAWHDYRTFEIDFAMLAIATFAVLPVIVVTEGLLALPGTLLIAGIFGCATWIAQRLKPGKIGLGDISLMAFIGFAAGPHEAVPVLAALVLFCVLTAAAYSIRRGKRLFKSMFPMALPGMIAAALALGLRFAEPDDWRSGLIGETLRGAGDVLILGIIVTTAFLIGMAVGARSIPGLHHERNSHEQ